MDENGPVGSGPTAAERIRTLVDGNASAVLDIPGITADPLALELSARTVLDGGDLLLHAPLRVTEEVAAVVEITDVAPVAVPHRVRGRAWVRGWLTTAHGDGTGDGGRLRLETAEAEIDDLWGTETVEPEDLAAAAADPLAPHEAELLQHLASSHGEHLDLLTSLMPCECAAASAVPVALDRFGLRVRYRSPDGRLLDARFDFPSPVGGPDDLRAAMSLLFEQARVAAAR